MRSLRKRAQFLHDLALDIKKAIDTYANSKLKRTPEEILKVVLKDYGDPFYEDFGKSSVLAYAAIQCGHLQRELVTLRNEHEQKIQKNLLEAVEVLSSEFTEIEELLKNLSQKSAMHVSLSAKVKTLEEQVTRKSSRFTIDDDKEGQRLEDLKIELEDSQKNLAHATDTTITSLMQYISKESGLAATVFQQSVQFQLDYFSECSDAVANYLPTLQDILQSYSLKPIFGVDLSNQDGISRVIEECCSMMHNLGLAQEGLLRVPGRTIKIKLIIAALNFPDPIHWSSLASDDIHSVGGAFKQYLRELPNPLLTFELYDEWIAVSKCLQDTNADQKLSLSKVNELLLQLPESHYINLRYVVKFLVEICKHSGENKMSPENVAIVMGSNMLHRKKDEGSSFQNSSHQNFMVETLIRHHDRFFPSTKFKPKVIKQDEVPDQANQTDGDFKSPHAPKQFYSGLIKFGGLFKSQDSFDVAFEDLKSRTFMIFDIMNHMSMDVSRHRETKRDRKLEMVIGNVLELHSKTIMGELGPKSLVGNLCEEVRDLEFTIVEDSVNYEAAIIKAVNRHMDACEDEIKIIKRNLEKVPRAQQKADAAKSRLLNLQSQYEKQGGMATSTSLEQVSLAERIYQAENEVIEKEKMYETEKDSLTTLMMNFISKEHQFSDTLLEIIDYQSEFFQSSVKEVVTALPKLKKRIIDFPLKPCFGTHLSTHLSVTKQKIARPLMELCNVMSELGLEKEGILRVPGGSSRTNRIIAALDYPGETDWTHISDNIHNVASAMKKYLRDLPEPLLTTNQYDHWAKLVKESESKPSQELLPEIEQLLAKIPKENHDNLGFLIQFLAQVSKNGANKMNLENVAIIMGTNIIWRANSSTLNSNDVAACANVASTVCQLLLKYHTKLFPGNFFVRRSYLHKNELRIQSSLNVQSQCQLPGEQVIRRRPTTLARKNRNCESLVTEETSEEQPRHRKNRVATVYHEHGSPMNFQTLQAQADDFIIPEHSFVSYTTPIQKSGIDQLQHTEDLRPSPPTKFQQNDTSNPSNTTASHTSASDGIQYTFSTESKVQHKEQQSTAKWNTNQIYGENLHEEVEDTPAILLKNKQEFDLTFSNEANDSDDQVEADQHQSNKLPPLPPNFVCSGEQPQEPKLSIDLVISFTLSCKKLFFVTFLHKMHLILFVHPPFSLISKSTTLEQVPLLERLKPM